MKKYIISLFLILNMTLMADDLPQVRKVFSFVSGNGNTMLGLGRPSNYGTPGPADICVYTNGDIAILDNENDRIIFFDKDYNFLEEVDNLLPNMRYLFIQNDRIVATSNMETSINFIAIDEKHKKIFSVEHYKVEGAKFKYLFFIDDIYIFNYRDKKNVTRYLGFVNTNSEIKYLDEKSIFALFSDINKSFKRIIRNNVGEMIFDGQKITPNDESFLFPAPVQNGNFLVPVWGEIRIYNSVGNLIFKFGLECFENEEYSLPHNFDSNGFIYTLEKDFSASKINIYKIGPFKELQLKFPQINKVVSVNNNNVRIREKSDTGSKIISSVNKGDYVQLLDISDNIETIGGVSSNWYKVKLDNDFIGWIFGAYVNLKKSTTP